MEIDQSTHWGKIIFFVTEFYEVSVGERIKELSKVYKIKNPVKKEHPDVLWHNFFEFMSDNRSMANTDKIEYLTKNFYITLNPKFPSEKSGVSYCTLPLKQHLKK